MPRQGMGPSLHSHQTSTRLQAAAQARDYAWHLVVTDPCCCRDMDSWRQHRPGPYYGLRWHHWVLTSGCSSLSLSLQFCLSSLCTYPSASLALPSLWCLHTHLNGAWGLWVSEVFEGVLCPAYVMWHRAGLSWCGRARWPRFTFIIWVSLI